MLGERLIPAKEDEIAMAGQRISVEGIDFNVMHEGDHQQPLVVLMHALMSNLHMWDSTVKALHDAGFSTLRYDYPGHGNTAAPAANKAHSYRFDDFVRHISDIVQTVAPGTKPFGMIGCSIGGVLVLRYAMMYGGEVTKIMSCNAPGIKTIEASKQKWQDRVSQYRASGVEPLAKATVDRWFPDPCPAGVKEEALKHTTSCSLLGYECCAEAVMNFDYASDLDKIQSEEVVILVGENDANIGPHQILQDVARQVKGARYIEMPDTGHIPPMHQTQVFEGIMLDFLKS